MKEYLSRSFKGLKQLSSTGKGDGIVHWGDNQSKDMGV